MSEPFRELPTIGDVFDQARAALADVRESGRGPDGQFQQGNLAALRHGFYSEQLADVPPVAVALAEVEAAIVSDCGGPDALSQLERAHVREAARLELLTAHAGDRLIAYGLTTSKGRARALVAVYVSLLDRQMKIGAALGLKRRSRPVPSISEWMQSDGAQK